MIEVTSAMNTLARKLFDEANDLWFRHGRTTEAIRKYEEASRNASEDPIVLFQLARALWGTSRAYEARLALSQAERHQEKLSPFGLKLLQWESPKINGPSDFRLPMPPFAPVLDIDVLEKQDLSPAQWLDVAFASRERGMFGLAAHAFGRSGGSTRIRELDQDENEMLRSADDALNALAVMDPNMRTPPGHQPVVSSLAAASDTSISLNQPQPDYSSETTTALQPVEEAVQQFAPIRVGITVEPARGPVTEPLMLTVTLTNCLDQPQAVNTRLLLNHPNSPPENGELYLNVNGPRGYENSVDFQVRTGAPKPEHFKLLSPGESVSREFDLLRYESLSVPGQYRLWVTYRNLVRDAVRGVPLFVGSVSSAAVVLERLPKVSGLLRR